MARKQARPRPSEDEFAAASVANEKIKEIIRGLMLNFPTKVVKIEVRECAGKLISRLATSEFTHELRDP